MTDDLLLRNACVEAKRQLLEEELHSLNQQADVVLPATMRRKILKSLDKLDAKPKKSLPVQSPISLKKNLKMGLLIAVLLVLLTIAVIATSHDSTTISFTPTAQSDSVASTFTPPDGFTLAKKEVGNTRQEILFLNDRKEFILITTQEAGQKHTFSVSESTPTRITVDGHIGYYVIEDDYITLLWCTGQYEHIIWAPLTSSFTVDNAIQLANSRAEK